MALLRSGSQPLDIQRTIHAITDTFCLEIVDVNAWPMERGVIVFLNVTSLVSEVIFPYKYELEIS